MNLITTLKRKKKLNRDEVIELCEKITKVLGEVHSQDILDLCVNALNASMALVLIKCIKEESLDDAITSIAIDLKLKVMGFLDPKVLN